MFAFIVKRLIWGVITLTLISLGSWYLVRSAPGDPFAAEMRSVDPAVKAELKKKYGIGEGSGGLFSQYCRWYGRMIFEFDFGQSMKYKDKSVNDIVKQSLPVSLALGASALMIAVFLGLVTGLIAGARQNTGWDYASMSMAVLGISLPSFVLAILLVIIFSFWLKWLPPAGWGSWSQLILPSFALALPYAAYISRLTRVGVLETLSQDYIRTAEAKGLAETVVIIKHALRGAILPVVSFLGPAAASMAVGSLVVEKIFFIPGLGQFFVKGAQNRDYFLVMGTVVIYSALLYFFNTLVDLSYIMLDPRLSIEEE